MEKLLSITDVELTYQSLFQETTAIKNLSFCVYNNEFVSIVGPSGCGKTTILSLVAGLIKPTAGTILLKSEKVVKPTNKIGYMFQKDNLFEWRTIEKNIELGLELQKRKQKKTKPIMPR